MPGQEWKGPSPVVPTMFCRYSVNVICLDGPDVLKHNKRFPNHDYTMTTQSKAHHVNDP